mgnify:CR=1 FL=1
MAQSRKLQSQHGVARTDAARRAWRFGGRGGVVCVSRAELLGLFVPVGDAQGEPRRAEYRAELDRWNAEVMRRLG